MQLLEQVAIFLLTAVLIVPIFQRLKLGAVLGYLAAGMIIGPWGLGILGDVASTLNFSEFGVVLLLFTIGLELSLARIIRLGRVVLLGGGLQVLATLVVVGAVALALAVPLGPAALFGALAALSSTAIVLRVYTDRAELDAPHGRVVIAILLFQDLCVVPLMLLVPMLAGTGAGAGAAALQMGVALVVTAVLILVGRVAIPRVLERVAALRNREIFTLAIVVLGLGSAYVTASVGLSLALGAFIAGLLADNFFGELRLPFVEFGIARAYKVEVAPFERSELSAQIGRTQLALG